MRGACLLLALALGGCDAVGNMADSVGEHMPVIGERCEHWQCMTSSGEAESEANKRREAMGAQTPPAQEPPEQAEPQPEEPPPQ